MKINLRFTTINVLFRKLIYKPKIYQFFKILVYFGSNFRQNSYNIAINLNIFCTFDKKQFIKRYRLHIAELKEKFGKRNSFTTDELYSFYESYEPGINRNTVNWRAYELIKLGIIIRIGRGIFQFGKNLYYYPNLSSKIKSIYRKIKVKFSFAEVCIWDTRFLNEFMIHQPGRFMTIVETESDVTDSLFQFLKETKKFVFINPDENIIDNYISGINDCVIVKSLISEAPTNFIGKVNTVTLEKLLVDILCDVKLFNAFQGTELNNIFNNAIETYAINKSKLVRYASRRGKKLEIEQLYNKYQTNGNKWFALPII